MNDLTAFIRSHIRASFGRHIQIATIFTVAIIAALFAFAFLLVAVRGWLSGWYQSPIKADLTIAGALALLSVVIAIAAEAVRRAPRPAIPTPISLAVAVPVAARIAPKLLSPRFLGIASVILGGVLIGREFSKK